MHDESKSGIKFKYLVLCNHDKRLMSSIAVRKTIVDLVMHLYYPAIKYRN